MLFVLLVCAFYKIENPSNKSDETRINVNSNVKVGKRKKMSKI